MIFPAGTRDTAPFEKPNYWFVEETPELYLSVTLPFIKKSILKKKKKKKEKVCKLYQPNYLIILY